MSITSDKSELAIHNKEIRRINKVLKAYAEFKKENYFFRGKISFQKGAKSIFDKVFGPGIDELKKRKATLMKSRNQIKAKIRYLQNKK